MAELTDDDLWRLYRQGEVEAFEALFCRHHTAVYQFARTILGRADQSEDVLQETFLALTRHADGYQPRGNFRGFILRIARNQCLNRIAARKAQRLALSQTGLEWIEPDSPEPHPPELAERNEDLAWIKAAVNELPHDQRQAIALLVYEQMSYPQIAELLEIPLGTVKNLIHRARARLAEQWRRTHQEK
ncbi:MAG: RNA polymerase sigma factor [Phycisphaeraceae bacterium]|nr:RNA polymerase sigma factor [Phycisphaeraceae bacterium]